MSRPEPPNLATEDAVTRAIVRLGATNEVEVSVVAKRRPSEVRQMLDALEHKRFVRRSNGRHSHCFGPSVELTGLGRRTLQ